jgi:hypothetical protein
MNTGVSRSIFFWKRRFLHESPCRDNARVVFGRGYGYLLWAVFWVGKIISRKDAEARRGGIFLCDLASLREKNHFTQSRGGVKAGTSSTHKFQVFPPPYFPTNVNVGANKHSPKLRCRAKPTAGCFRTPPRGGASPIQGYPDIFGKSDGADIAVFFIPWAVLPGTVGRMFIRPYAWNWGGGGNGPGRLSESGFSGF